MDLADLGAVALGASFRSGAASPIEATRAVLDRIEAREPQIKAFVAVDQAGALAAAAQSEQRHRRHEQLGPLDGVTATVKDLLDVAGMPTRRGSRLKSAAPAPHDTPAVARLRRAGCVLLGKTTTTEQGWSALSTNPPTGTTHNPWRPGLTAGGSAAAAAGMGVLYIGTDGAGSVRLPAHFCGVVGVKATFGTVPNVPLPNNDGLSHTGPIARTVEDAALMLDVMAGPDAGDPTSLTNAHLQGRIEAGDLRGLRIAYSPDLGHLRVDADVRDVVDRAVRRLGDELGATVERVDPPWAGDAPEIMAGYWATVFRDHLNQPSAALAQLDPAFLARPFGPGWMDRRRLASRPAACRAAAPRSLVTAMGSADRRTPIRPLRLTPSCRSRSQAQAARWNAAVMHAPEAMSSAR